MTVTADDRLLAAGDESGTAPGDRKFRPDVQGLRAVAILLVVLYHAGIPGIGGGYVGVDVFFVISGFVITGVLLRERVSKGSTSILSFYGRRVRRIIPAATLVIIVTVVAAYAVVGSASGRATAVDGLWASVFLSNVHFAATSTNYLASQALPSPLQNFWSLAVEEQFYVVYPTLFLIVAGVFTRRALRARIGVVLGAIIIGSYALSILWTTVNPSGAFFSPFTRAWELALGGVIAVGSDRLRQVPPAWAAGMSWVGLAGILAAAFTLSSASVYPGWLVAIPVIGAGLIIGGGTVRPRWGVESVLSLRPLQWLGLVSYSLYLWHWPILIIAAERRGSSSLPVADNIVLLLVALVVSVATYRLVENPIRHSPWLRARRWGSVALGGCLIIASLAVCTFVVWRVAPTVTGPIAVAPSASDCASPQRSEIATLYSAYLSSHPPVVRPADPPLRMVVAGDSTTCTLLPGLAAVGSYYGVQIVNAAVIGCGIVEGEAAPVYIENVNLSAPTEKCAGEARSAETSALAKGTPDIIVWGSTEESTPFVDTPGTTVLDPGTPQWKKVMLQRMDNRLEQFIATGAKVVLLLEPARGDVASHKTPPSADDIYYEKMNALLVEVAARHPKHVAVVDLAARVCPSGPACPYVVDGMGDNSTGKGSVRPDTIHYGPSGSLWTARWLIPRILTAAKSIP
jgi:peptidoglycan/LPS O-acetylase OafA/YrhL